MLHRKLPPSELEFRLDPVGSEPVIALIGEHLTQMRAQSPVCSVHAMDLGALRGSDMRFWSVWLNDGLIGCVALKRCSGGYGEIKSMHVRKAFRGKGYAHAIVQFVMEAALEMGLSRLSLETGSTDSFAAARNLYQSHGFEETEPFGDYNADPHSFFMTCGLEDARRGEQ